MENPAAEDIVDIATARILDLRSLGQDEIRSMARLCGDVPHDIINVIVDKSIFNESAGSRRQTYDRNRKEERRLSSASASASAQLRLDVEGAGQSHRDLIVRLCRQLHIAEKGDNALYPQTAVGGGNGAVRLKRMARVCLTGVQDPSMPAAAAAANAAAEVSYRPSKKRKTKEETRRRSAIAVGESQAEAVRNGSNLQGAKAMQVVNIICSGSEERFSLKDASTHAVSVIGMNAPTQVQNDLKSSVTLVAQSTGTLMDGSEPLKLKHKTPSSQSNKRSTLLCVTCGKTFSYPYNLRRHATKAGHMMDQKFRNGMSSLFGDCLCSICGNAYVTPFSLKMHEIKTGHAVHKTSRPAAERQFGSRDEIEGTISEKGLTLRKTKVEPLWPRRSWKNEVRQFQCRQSQRRSSRKEQSAHRLGTHIKKSRKKIGRPVSKLVGSPVGRSSGKVKGRPVGRPPKLDGEKYTKQAKEKQKRNHDPESLGKRLRPRGEEGSMQRMTEKPMVITCQECGKVFDEYSHYAGHLSMHLRWRRLYAGGPNKTNASDDIGKQNMFNTKELSTLGFRRLLSNMTGTFMSGLPAKLLFSRSLDLSGLQKE